MKFLVKSVLVLSIFVAFGSQAETPAAVPTPTPLPVATPAVAPVAPVAPVVAPVPCARPCGRRTCFGCNRGYGAYFRYGAHGVAAGAFGVMRPAWYGPMGRYPKLWFAAPIRRRMGLPGFTPLRQFAFGRGAIRRQMRRGCFGRCYGPC